MRAFLFYTSLAFSIGGSKELGRKTLLVILFSFFFFLIDDARQRCLIDCTAVCMLTKRCDKQAPWRNQLSAFLNAILNKSISVTVLEKISCISVELY